ncbi:hypothetical protein ACN28S_47515 [Cystobacter fuscus]
MYRRGACLPTPHVTKSVYAWAMTQAGFRQLEWRHFEIPPEAVEKFGAEFWRSTGRIPLLVALTGRR